MAKNYPSSKFMQKVFNEAILLAVTANSDKITVNYVTAALLSVLIKGIENAEFSDEKSINEFKLLESEVGKYVLACEWDRCKKELIECPFSEKDSVIFVSCKDKAVKFAEERGLNELTMYTMFEAIVAEPSEAVIKTLRISPAVSATASDVSAPNTSTSTSSSSTPAQSNADRINAILSRGKTDSSASGSTAPTSQSSSVTETAFVPATVKAAIKNLTKEVKELQKYLESRVFGQNHAISIFTAGYFEAIMADITQQVRTTPKATFLLAGPPGCGKTFMATLFAEKLGLPFKCFNMSEYVDDDSIMELIGNNGSYKNAKEGLLTSFVQKNPKSVILFDEVEKAHINIINLFLQVLDGAKLSDINSSQVVDFKDTILIFTTNAARTIYEGAEEKNLSSISKKVIVEALEKDVDPKTGRSAFPAAICSRLAMGNVIMFNHMEAHYLRKIAKSALDTVSGRFFDASEISFDIEENIYSTLLFAEGGAADARTIKARARSFFTSELYELFRLLSREDNKYDLEKLEKIIFKVDLADETRDVLDLYGNAGKNKVIVFADSESCIDVLTNNENFEVSYTNDLSKAMDLVDKTEYDFILCDICTGIEVFDSKRLNIEDIKSAGREFFRYICENSTEPIYLICNDKKAYSSEEIISLIDEGARDLLCYGEKDEFMKSITEIAERIYQQNNMLLLSRANKIMTFETAQYVSEDEKTAEIRLFELQLETSVSAEDRDSVLSNMSRPDVCFDDITGQSHAKEELAYFVDYLKQPKAYLSRGLSAPKGLLFYGPPGTGKTMLAKALAGESGVTFIAAEGNQFRQKYVGDGEKLVHKLFATARKYAPSILFIDEIDAIAKERSGNETANDSILTAFLAEMDGFKTNRKKPVFVLAATNFDVEPGKARSLDSALLRRFDRLVYVDLPEKNDRIVFLKGKNDKMQALQLSDAEIESIAIRSTGMSLANLDNVINFAMRLAVRKSKHFVDDEIFEEAFETFVFGEEKKWSPEQLTCTARHEAGHAFLAWHSGNTPAYVTVVARGDHGGYMQYGDMSDKGSYTKAELLARIRTSLGGRATEIVYYGHEQGLTTGASADLRNATNVAKAIVCDYGMSEELGLAVIGEKEILNSGISAQVREVINGILSQELVNAIELIDTNKAAIDELVKVLLETDKLQSNEIDEIFSRFSSRPNR